MSGMLAANPAAHVTDFTEAEIAAAVRADDPSVWRFFGAKLKDSVYSRARRTAGQENAHQAIVARWAPFAISGHYDEPPDGKAWLWEVVRKQTGNVYLAFDQKLGSCVGNGCGQTVNYLSSIDAWMRNDRSKVEVPYFWLYPYGISRYMLDPNDGPGEGSMGSAIAEAVKTHGIFAQDHPQLTLPAFDDEGGTGRTWGKQAELDWSFINPAASKWVAFEKAAKEHPVVTSSLLKSADEVAQALINFYPVTCASEWGGLMQCPTAGGGANAYLQNHKADVWPHQQCILGWWRHPTDGELFFIQNSWGINAHGLCPTGAPPGGYWVKRAEVEWMLRNDGELIVYSGYQGYPANLLDWTAIYQ